MMILLFIIIIFLQININDGLNVALHAQVLPMEGEKVVGSVVTTDGLLAAFKKRDEVDNVEIFYPFSYKDLFDHQWDLVLIEGWFPAMNSFIHMIRVNFPNAIVIFICLDPTYPGMQYVHKFDVDGFLTNSRDENLMSELLSISPTEFMLLATDDEAMKPISNIKREYGATYIGAGGQMLIEKPLLQAILEASVPFGLQLYGSGWDSSSSLKSSYKGFLPRGDIAIAYASTHIVLAVTIESQDKAGMINNRIFEALSCGTIIISPYSYSLERVFGKDLIHYINSPEEISSIIQYYIDNPLIAEERRIKSRNAVLGAHTWGHRILQIFDFEKSLRLSAITNKRTNLPKLLWIKSSKISIMEDYKFMVLGIKKIFEKQYDIIEIDENEWMATLELLNSSDGIIKAQSESKFGSYAVIFAAFTLTSNDIVSHSLHQLPMPGSFIKERYERLQRIMCFGIASSSSIDNRIDPLNECTVESDDGEFKGACMEFVSGLTQCDSIAVRDSYDHQVVKQVMKTLDKSISHSVRIQQVMGLPIQIQSFKNKNNSITMKNYDVFVCLWSQRYECTIDNYRLLQKYTKQQDLQSGISTTTRLLLVGADLSDWSLLSESVAMNDIPPEFITLASTSAWPEISLNLITHARQVLLISGGNNEDVLWPFMAAATSNTMIRLTHSNPRVLASQSYAGIWTYDHFHKMFSKAQSRLHAFASARANVDVDYPVSNVELETCNSFWLDTRFYNFRPGIDGRMSLMQHGENITCSVTPVIKFLVELKPCNISNIKTINNLKFDISLTGVVFDDAFWMRSFEFKLPERCINKIGMDPNNNLPVGTSSNRYNINVTIEMDLCQEYK